MLNKEMVQFFESILEERSDEFRVTESDLVSPSAFEKKQAKIRRKVPSFVVNTRNLWHHFS